MGGVGGWVGWLVGWLGELVGEESWLGELCVESAVVQSILLLIMR